MFLCCYALRMTTNNETVKTMTEGGNSQGVSYFVKLDKHGNKYKAISTIIFSTHNEIVDWNEPGMVDLMELGAGRTVRCMGNHFFYANPYAAVVDATTGLITARIEQIAIRDTFTLGHAEDAISAHGYAFCRDQIQHLNNEIEKASDMARMKPETNPTDAQLVEMVGQLDRLIGIFSVPGIVALTGVTSATVNQWKKRGRIGAQAAHEICQIKEIKNHGFTRESMRPDVGFWYIDVK